MTSGPAGEIGFNDRRSVRLKYAAKGLLARFVPHDRLLWCRRRRRFNGIALTFDDGPHPDVTPRLLDILDDLDAKATFFVLGSSVRRHGTVARSIVERGHEIGIHGFEHRSIRSMTDAEIVDQVARTEHQILTLGARAVTLYRPPQGEYRVAQLPLLWKLGKTVVLWSVDARDFAVPSAEGVLSNVSPHLLRGGDVVLLHDGFEHTVRAMRTLVPALRQHGFRPTTVSEMTRDAESRPVDD